jgi:hypothetical protein
VRDYVHPFIAAIAAEVSGERNGHAADATADIQHVMMRPETTKITKMSQELASDSQEITSADKAESARRYKIAATVQKQIGGIEAVIP